jgi:predicted nucleic acid-binding protein
VITPEFVDTNVLLYAYDAGAGERHDQARRLVSGFGSTRRGALSVQVLQEFYVNAVRKMAVPASPEAALGRLKLFSTWTVHSPTAADVIAAAALSQEHLLSFWDAMIVRSASQLGCSVLWTEDLKHGQVIDGVRVSNPFA